MLLLHNFGHLLELKSIGDYEKDKERDKKWTLVDLPFFPKEFEYKVKGDSGVKARYNVIKSLVKRNDITEIVNAGDPDREGETLVNIVIYRIFEELKVKKKVTRIWLDPLTEEKVRDELGKRKPIEKTENLFKEGKTRAYLDWLYGINLTEYNTLKVGKLMNTGRVIIPLVRWVYDRDEIIKNFIPEKYYPIDVSINKNGIQVKLNFSELKFKEKDEAKKILDNIKNEKVRVVSIESKEQTKQPKKLFSLSTLQTYMFQKNKITISNTLKIVQSLYEKGFLTYPRTDTEYLSEDEKDKVKDILIHQNNKDLEFRESKNIFDSSKVESHTAIIITTKTPKIEELDELERKVYLVVRNRFYANFCKEKCIIDKTIVNFEMGKYKTKLTGTTIKQKGYLKYENDIGETELPEFELKEELIPKLKISEKETEPPPHLSESDLIKLCKNPFKDLSKEDDNESLNDDEEYKKILEGSQIGTEATRAIMIEKIKSVGYVKVEKNKLLITEYGIKFIETLKTLNENLWKEKTAELNKSLKRISKGELEPTEVIQNAKQEITEIFNQNIEVQKVSAYIGKKGIGKCPICGKDVFENLYSYRCIDYKNGCNFSIQKKIAGKTIIETNIKQLLKNGETNLINGFKSKNGKNFSAKLVLDKDKVVFKF